MATKVKGTPLGTPEVGAGLESSKELGFPGRRVLGGAGGQGEVRSHGVL